MICRFTVRWFSEGKLDSHIIESGYISGTNCNDCFCKLHDWYFGADDEEYDEMETIQIETVPWEDDDCNILVTSREEPTVTEPKENSTINRETISKVRQLVSTITLALDEDYQHGIDDRVRDGLNEWNHAMELLADLTGDKEYLTKAKDFQEF